MRFILAFILLMYSGISQGQGIPPQAFQYSSIIQSEIQTYFDELPYPEYVPALIEHESCITLRHRKCWNPKSELRTKRERGLGLGQITVAYNPDGSIRFDKLTELRTKYKRELYEARWDTIATRPDVQIRMIILMLKADYGKLYDVKDPYQRLSMVDSAYNGGYGGLQKERRRCSLTKGCDSGVWFDNVESHCLKSKKPLYGNRSACMINRDHVRLTVVKNMPRYQRAQYFLR